jgi:hypothetical protein
MKHFDDLAFSIIGLLIHVGVWIMYCVLHYFDRRAFGRIEH